MYAPDRSLKLLPMLGELGPGLLSPTGRPPPRGLPRGGGGGAGRPLTGPAFLPSGAGDCRPADVLRGGRVTVPLKALESRGGAAAASSPTENGRNAGSTSPASSSSSSSAASWWCFLKKVGGRLITRLSSSSSSSLSSSSSSLEELVVVVVVVVVVAAELSANSSEATEDSGGGAVSLLSVSGYENRWFAGWICVWRPTDAGRETGRSVAGNSVNNAASTYLGETVRLAGAVAGTAVVVVAVVVVVVVVVVADTGVARGVGVNPDRMD
jgi:hypothetical protein